MLLSSSHSLGVATAAASLPFDRWRSNVERVGLERPNELLPSAKNPKIDYNKHAISGQKILTKGRIANRTVIED